MPPQNFSNTMTSINNPPLPPQNLLSQTHSNLPRRERSLSNESRKREKSVERTPNMMKREVNNSRVNLDTNNASTISTKPRPGPGQNPSTVSVPQQPRNVPVQGAIQERMNPMQNTQQFAQQQNQQVNVSTASSNFLSQGNTNSVASSRANQQSDPFSSFPQSTLGNNRIQQGQMYGQTQQLSAFTSQHVNLAIYPAPHPISPLGKHLSKLVPPNEQVIKFFNDLFAEPG
jgi:hypothetical protein